MHQNCYDPTCTFPNMLLIVARKQTWYGDTKNSYVESVLSCHSAAAPFRGRVQAGVGGISRILNPWIKCMCELTYGGRVWCRGSAKNKYLVWDLNCSRSFRSRISNWSKSGILDISGIVWCWIEGHFTTNVEWNVYKCRPHVAWLHNTLIQVCE